MTFFNGKSVREYTDGVYKRLREEIDVFSNHDITTCDDDEWIDYFYSKYYVNPITLFEDNINREINEAKIKRANQFYRRGHPYEAEYYMLDGYKITYKIPYEGVSNLLFLTPSSFIMKSFHPENHITPFGKECGSFSLSFEYTNNEVKNVDDINEKVTSDFNHEFNSYKTMIQNINNEIIQFNNSLKNKAKTLLEERRKKASDYIAISEELNIPLNLSNDAPNVAPVPLKRIERLPQKARPQSKPMPKEYSISNEDYNNIINIIHNSCSMMENTPETFNSLEEENLRDIVISSLGTHYVNEVSGETFRKKGKTDILIVFENKAAFVAECKIWDGVKTVDDALKQIYGYTTWKDTKIAIVIFNKTNKDFISLLNKVQEWINVNTIQHSQKHSNVWKCKIHRVEINENIELSIAVYDINV